MLGSVPVDIHMGIDLICIFRMVTGCAWVSPATPLILGYLTETCKEWLLSKLQYTLLETRFIKPLGVNDWLYFVIVMFTVQLVGITQHCNDLGFSRS